MAKRVIWTTDARLDVSAIDRNIALRLLKSLDSFLQTDAGNVKQLEGFDPPQYRIRFGDWQIVFRKHGKDEIDLTSKVTLNQKISS